MAYEQTKDVLRRARTFHHQLAEAYHQIGETTDRPRMQMLLNYMSEHEKGLEKCLTAYEELAGNQVLDAWFQFTPELVPDHTCAPFELGPDMSVGDVVAVALEFDTCLMKYYEQLVADAPSRDLKNLFEELLASGKRAAIELSRSAQELEQL